MIPSDQLLSLLSPLLPATALPVRGATFGRPLFLRQFAAATRILGTAPLAGTSELFDDRSAWLLQGISADEALRVLLLVDASAQLSPSEMIDLAEDCFRHGDNAERRAVLRTLAVFPDPARYVALAADACRSHVRTVFEALACENPFPALFFPEANFNQMVLKALFTEARLDRVMGLEGRITPELARMASDYEAERRAAGRTVPADIERLVRRP